MKSKSKNPENQSAEIQSRPLVGDEELLAALFDESIRPSLRWLRRQREKRLLPFKSLGHVVAWDVEEVRRAIDRKRTVRATGR